MDPFPLWEDIPMGINSRHPTDSGQRSLEWIRSNGSNTWKEKSTPPGQGKKKLSRAGRFQSVFFGEEKTFTNNILCHQSRQNTKK